MSTCLTYLRALRAHLLSVPACLHAFDSYMPFFLRALRVFFFYVSYVSSFCYVPYIPSIFNMPYVPLSFSVPNILSFLRALSSFIF